MNTLVPHWPTLVMAHLSWGRDRAKTIGQIQEGIGCSRRIVEKAVEELRKAGSPIVTGSDGVWLTDSPAELRAAYRSLRARYIHQAVGARVLLKTAARFERAQQQVLWSDVA